MTLLDDLRDGAAALGIRTVVRAHALRGDPLSRALVQSPHVDARPLLRDARARGDLSRSALGVYVAISHPAAGAVLRDPRFRVGGPGGQKRDTFDLQVRLPREFSHPIADSMLSVDPPVHTRLRQSAGPWFTRRALDQRADQFDALVDKAVAALPEYEAFDLVDDYATPLNMRIIGELLGLPEQDHPLFARWGVELSDCLDGVWSVKQRNRLGRAAAEMDAYFSAQLARRRVEPGDDVLTALAWDTEPDGGEPVPARREAVATAGLLLFAGFETSASLIACTVLHLLGAHQDRDWHLEHPDRTADLVEEMVRLYPPIRATPRVASEPVEVAGVQIPRDGVVLAMIGGANRDPLAFPDPHTFNPDRTNSREHLSFSAGVHYCIGSYLARIVGEKALRALFDRFPALQQAGPHEYVAARNIQGLRHLPVRGHGPSGRESRDRWLR